MDEAFRYQVDFDKHSHKVFLIFRATDEEDEYDMSITFDALTAAALAVKLVNAARDALDRG